MASGAKSMGNRIQQTITQGMARPKTGTAQEEHYFRLCLRWVATRAALVWLVVGLALGGTLVPLSLVAQEQQQDEQKQEDAEQQKDKKKSGRLGLQPEGVDKGMDAELERVGTITFTAQYGVQNITNFLHHPETGEQRQVVIDDYGSGYMTLILSLRFGTHVQGWEDINNGFRYNRSNKGFFTDFEFGIKTYGFGNASEQFATNPLSFTMKHTGGPNTLPGGVDEHTVTLAERKELGDDIKAVFPWQYVDENDEIQTIFLYTEDDSYPAGFDTTDDSIQKLLESHGPAATKSMTVFINSYYHFNLFHWLFGLVGADLGTVFDSSIGLSLRFNRYVDYTDFNRFVSYNTDNIQPVIGIITRNYINFGKKLRTKLVYMFPVVGFWGNLANRHDINQEEHIAEVAIEYYVMPYIYLSVGAQYSYYPFNDAHPHSKIRNSPEGGDDEISDNLDRVRGIYFADGEYNHGFYQDRREAWEIYGAVSFDLNL